MKGNEKNTLKDNATIVVNREWGNTGKSRPYFQRFLEQIRTFYQTHNQVYIIQRLVRNQELSTRII